ncbi:hypothetical protein [Pedobacter panaciterrae]|nr:hypothetical protein [uncultured Pedobacter sp.]
MEQHQSPEGLQITIVLVTLAVIIVVTAFYLTFRKKKDAHHSGH